MSGIADLQVAVGLDDAADADGSVDRWVEPGDPTWDGVPRALRIELEARSDVSEPDQPGSTRQKRVVRIVEFRNTGFLP